MTEDIPDEKCAQSTPAPISTGIVVIIVGLGIAGLTAAIECHRKGHSVIGFEKKPDPYQFGDLICLSGNSVGVLAQWDNGSVMGFLKDNRSYLHSIEAYDEAGDLKDKTPVNPDDATQGFVLRRSGLLKGLYQYAQKLGLDLRFGVQVEEYWETEGNAGVIVGKIRIGADCVIASDGVHSRARGIITGEDPAPQETGGAIFRSHFDAHLIADNPEARWILEGTAEKDRFEGYFGKNVAVMVGTLGKGQHVFWSCPHKDVKGVSEAWAQVADVNPVLEYIKDWPTGQKLAAIISKTPRGNCFNHLLLSRDPLNSWVSKGGRMIVIGDAAHPFLPHTGQGANQSIEDAAVVAICLELAGRDRIPLALRVTEKLRHKRVSVIQRGSIEVQKNDHKANWDSSNTEDRPSTAARPTWVFSHDCAKHAYEEFNIVANAITNGQDYIETNVPADGIFRRVDDYHNTTRGSN
ncbi:unnamed protein product [Penicillium egyptiacum]|uniref:FAD-binding domain-containing protein n=1 Tax=Penicillium egyptiacum TaxID=1303716 RepID=A0A9W4P8T3_9EURO|nr:unnamed protein product [Penicillium egyptiacum]